MDENISQVLKVFSVMFKKKSVLYCTKLAGLLEVLK